MCHALAFSGTAPEMASEFADFGPTVAWPIHTNVGLPEPGPQKPRHSQAGTQALGFKEHFKSQ